jgi:hypothetical protein
MSWRSSVNLDFINLVLQTVPISFYQHVRLRQVVKHSEPSSYNRSYGRRPGAGFDPDGDEVHYPTRPVDKDKAEQELVVNIKKATNTEETAPKQKHVRSMCANLGLMIFLP